MDARVLFVAPFRELAERAALVARERFAAEAEWIRVADGDLTGAVDVARRAAADGVDVVVSRGGTADLIARSVDVPVVHIQVTAMDILHALMENGAYPDKVGIVGFENMLYDCEMLEKLLRIELRAIVIEGERDAAEKIAAAARSGVKLIVGDAVSTKLARRYGLQGEFIRSGKAAIQRALGEALRIARIRRAEQEKAALLRQVVHASAEGIVAVDGADRVTLLNPAAERIFRAARAAVADKPLAEALPGLSRLTGDAPELRRVGGKDYAVKCGVIRVKDELLGRVYTLQNVTQVQQLERSIRKKLHEKGLVARYRLEQIVGVSAACQAMKRKAEKYARTQSTVLVTGESGTGKEVLVQGIHNASARADGPFVAVNCAALPENLLESELFGYADGAFTGARKGGRQGLFELAHGGTIFLDEIGEMPLTLQSRLLRVLQERVVMRVGGDSVIPVDVRVVAATNQNLARMVEEKMFRQDLYYRVNILRVHMPTLSERAEDIPPLARHFVKAMQSVNPRVRAIDAAACAYLRSCRWPGNIRQLVNTVERAMLLSTGEAITRDDAAEAYGEDGEDALPPRSSAATDNLAALERETLRRVLEEENFNYSRAAARLGIHRTTLWRRLKR